MTRWLNRRYFCQRIRHSVTLVLVIIIVIYAVLISFAHLRLRTLHDKVTSSLRTLPETRPPSISASVDAQFSAVSKKSTIVPEKCLAQAHQNFPLCASKLKFLSVAWRHTCFKDVHGVTNTPCSLLQYLSEVEHFCPILPHRRGLLANENSHKIDETALRTEPDELLRELSSPDLQWMRKRITQLWPGWKEAAKMLKKQKYMKNRQKKKLLFFMGSQSAQPWLLSYAGRGGPLGELLQWTDIISGAYLLGHDIKVVHNTSLLNEVLEHADSKGCIPTKISRSKEFDVIFTDINGMNVIGVAMKPSILTLLRCKIRLLDSFGTQAEFNNNGYSGKIIGGGSPWGKLDLLLPQFMTLFPHTPDNSFLGFVAGNNNKKKIVKKNRAVVYGKLSSYFQGHKEYLDIIHEYFEIHATAVKVDNSIPDYVINHGSVDGKIINELLRESKVFVGLGFPYEGPGPLEAAIHGTVFINPKFAVPKNRLTEGFFKDKPTSRKLTSQNPYMEDFIEEPYTYTIDVKNKGKVREVLRKIAKMEKFEPYLPTEFTQYGFAERLHAYIHHQDFCSSTKDSWPPLRNKQLYLSEIGETCTAQCKGRGLVCEGTYFNSINKRESFQRFRIRCLQTRPSDLVHAPSYEPQTGTCYLQGNGLSFSCDGQTDTLRRLCPCRDFIKGQVAICENCLN